MMVLAIHIKSLGETMNELTPEQVAWLAGIYEGEGSCAITTGRAIRVEIVMTDQDVIDRIQFVTGLGSVTSLAPRGENYKPAYRWSIGSIGAVGFLNAILPWLGKRRADRAQNAIDNWNSNKKQSIAADIACINGHFYDQPGNRRTKYGTCHLCNLAASARYRQKRRALQTSS
jgi:hypothetical protein